MRTQLGRLQWAVRAVLTLGVAASITANILHARPNIIAQCIAAWPPLALLITVELVSRIPIYQRALGYVRIIATTIIAGIAAWISYWHMTGVVARYGETGTVPYLLPLSVDGLIVVASVSLVELAGRRLGESPRVAPAVETPAGSVPVPVPLTTPPVTATSGAGQPEAEPSDRPTAASGPDQTDIDLRNDPPSRGDPAPEDQPEPAPEQQDDDEGVDDQDGDEDGVDLAADLVPLLPAARTARDELIGEGRTVSRDALAHRLRRNGHAIRNNRVSELLNALRREELPVNGARPTVAA
jgi:hypothetical protein